jgi:hypothetical protein
METSRPYTTRTKETIENFERGFERMKKGIKRKSKPLTERQLIEKDINDLYLQYLNKRSNYNYFIRKVVEYIIKVKNDKNCPVLGK